MSDTYRTDCLRWISFVVLFFLASFATLASALPDGVREIRHLEGVTEYKLDSNGLTILLAPDASSPSVSVNVTYLVGSRHENYGQTGMAHLLEHMIFKGTPTIRNAMAEFSKRGLQFNGTTSVDRTNYFATFAYNPELLDWYIRWQADAMVNALILREDLDSEMTVVRNEMERSENNPVRTLIDKTRSAAYQWHNYGKTTIGARSDVEEVDIEQLRDFYRLYYQPDNAVLTVAGKFDPQQTLVTIADAFGSIPRPDRTLPRQYTVEPVQDGERRVTLRRNGGTPVALSVYHIPAATHPDFAAVELATNILGDTPSGRLYKALVTTELAVSVGSGAWDAADPSTALFLASLGVEQDTEKALSVMNKTVESIRDNPFTEEELKRAKASWLNDWNQTYSDMTRVGILLSDPIAQGDWRMFFKHRDRIQQATLEEVQKAAETYFLQANRTEGIYIPTEKPVRAPAFEPVDLQAMLDGYETERVDSLVGSFDPSPANIDAMTVRKVLNLPSGAIKLALLPKESRGDRVDASIELRFGDAESLKGKATISSVTADMLDYGTQELNRAQIRDRFNELETEVSFGGGGTGVRIDLSGRKGTLPEAIRLALHILKNPSFPEDQVEEFINRAITQTQAAMTEPNAIAGNALARYGNPWPSDDLRYVPTFEESIDLYRNLKRQDLVDFHENFYGNGAITMAVVGSFDPEAVELVLKEELSDWRKAPEYTRIADPFIELKPDQMILETPDKANAIFLGKLPIPLQDTDPDYPAMVLVNYLIGDQGNSRLWTRIRETDGLSYGVGSYFNASAFEPNADWQLYAIYAPENRARLSKAFQEVLEHAIQDGFTEDELKTAVQAILNQRALARSRDSVLTNTWMNYLTTNRTFEWSQAFDDKIKALTLADVNTALRKYIKPEQLVEVFAGDFAKSNEKPE